MSEAETPDLLARLTRALAGQYRVERLLGQGGMGSVFLGHDESLDRPVAIKVVSPDVAGSADVRQRFVQESRTVARLRHPNIVAVYAAGETDGLLYFVMEYVAGESLRDRLTRERTIGVDDATTILHDLGLALDYAHAAGVVHRDVKPENVLLDRESGRAMLTDFGVARALASADLNLTGAGFVLGSPRYMSPEQASGDKALDGRSDLYSLGLIAYEMFSGEPAVDAPTFASVLVKHLTERVPPLQKVSSGIPLELAGAVDRLLEKDPAARFQRGAAFAAALTGDAFDDTTPASKVGRAPVSRRSGATTSRRSRTRLLAVGGAAVAVIAAAAVIFGGGRSTNTKEWMVAPFEVQGVDRSLEWLREGSVNMLTLSLAQWQDLHVVEYERTLDLLRDEHLDTERRVGLEQARKVARRAGAGRVVMGQVQSFGDSIIVTASLYDVKSGNSVDKARVARSKSVDPRVVFESVAGELLDLAGAPRLSLDLVKQTTTSVEAYRHYLEGLRHLNAWRLFAADSAFRRATALDSTFALAYYKQSLALGWDASTDTMRLIAADRAVQFAARLPARQQEIVRGHADLTRGFTAAAVGDTAGARNGFLASRNRVSKLVMSDSLDAEAWYALADADYHLIWGTSYGTSADSTAKYLNESLQGFRRTIALDSTFHLAFQHLVEMYDQASTPRSFLVLVGDSIKAGGKDEDERRIGTPDQVAQLRAAASQRAREAAYGWIASDPDARSARRVLANYFDKLGMRDSAIATLEKAQANPSTASVPFEWQIAVLKVKAFRKGAGPELRELLDRVPADTLKRFGVGDRLTALMSTISAGGMAGMPSLVSEAAARLNTTDPVFPDPSRTPSKYITQMYTAALRANMGLPLSSAERAAYLASLKGMQQAPPNRRDVSFAYTAYLVTRDPAFLEAARPLLSPGASISELEALEALRRGDTATAQRLARSMPSVDSLRRATLGMNGARAVARATLFAELGDARRAVELLESIDPARFNVMGFVEVGWPVYIRSFLLGGRLYEQLGERDKAIASYERFLALWPDADASLQPQLSEARQAIARLRDVRPGVAAPAITPKGSR